MVKIYIADDETNICELMKTFLVREGYEVETFSNGNDLIKAYDKEKCDLVILDIMMPNVDGYATATMLRTKSNVPIIFVSAKDSESDRITGFVIGCDDYLVKPFSPVELVMRVKALIRRVSITKQEEEVLSFGDIKIMQRSKTATCQDQPLELTTMETNFLTYLFETPDRAVSRDELLQKIWGYESEADTRATDDMVKRLRKKLKDANSNVKINTIWGFGFKLGCD